MKCQTCERRNKEVVGECLSMKKQFEGCWAYTEDPKWQEKAESDIKLYSGKKSK